jgi:DNA-binding MarR family transcriptional regulator/GNAT superfamily N-acetyltransferase
MAAPTVPILVDSPSVQAVRQFNRFYTRQIGVLQEHLLDSQFSLTEVRVLYELAHRQRPTAKDLCEELGLDRGYLSRMLQSFEKQGWIKTSPSEADRRRIHLSLTAKGERTIAPLDRRSGQEVAAMMGKLSSFQQGRLLSAMGELESVLNPKLRSQPYSIRSHRPGDMGWVVQRHGELYFSEYGYDERFEALVAEIVAEFIRHFDPTYERCWIAEREGERLGSIFLVRKSKSVAKLRLLLAEPRARGLGIGRRLVAECVSFAREAGYRKIVLWTQSELHAARRLYEEAGFQRTKKQPHASWGRKDLVSETWELRL